MESQLWHYFWDGQQRVFQNVYVMVQLAIDELHYCMFAACILLVLMGILL